VSAGFSVLDNPNHQGNTDIWLTPAYFIEQLGTFDLDPCGHWPRPFETARKTICLPEDGLSTEWTGRVWLNPPYGKQIGHWLRKLQEHGNGIALVFSRTDTRWFQELKPDLTFFISGRIKFLKHDTFQEATNAGHGSCLLAFGRKNAAAILNSDIKGVWKC
jgi:hypothetical protein